MDIDRGLTLAVLASGISSFHGSDITAEMVEGSGRTALDFIDAYWREHGKMPTRELVCDQVGIDFYDVPAEPLSFWGNEVKKRFLHNAMREVQEAVLDKMDLADPFGALDVYRQKFFDLESLFRRKAGAEALFGDIDEIKEYYERSKLGITGIPTPYPILNELTQGWQPEDFIVIAARPGAGKTMLALNWVMHAWKCGRKGMIVTTEMSKAAMRLRAASMATRTPYGKLKRGKLTSTEEASFFAALEKMRDDPRLLIMGNDLDVNLEFVEAQALIHKPDMLLIDGFYLMRSSRVSAKASRHERIAEMLDMAKAMAKRLGIPVIITTQLNRGGGEKGQKKQSAPDLERLAFSDNMGMIADYVFFLDRTQKMREAKEMRLTPVKVREGEFNGAIIISWDFDHCEFGQRRIEDASSRAAPPPPDEEQPPPSGASGPMNFYGGFDPAADDAPPPDCPF